LQAGDKVTQDIAGHDHRLLKRYEGSLIVAYSEKAYDEYKLILGKALNPSADTSQGKRVEKEQAVEGRITRITYLAPIGRSALEVSKNYENELKAKGAETLFSGANPEGLGYDFGGVPQFEDIDGQLFGYSHTKARYTAYKLENTYVAIYTAEFEDGATHHEVEKKQTAVQVDIIESKPMEEKMVAISAEKMAGSIESSGKITLYGIYFDTNKTELKPESAPTLAEIAKLLAANPKLNLLVGGHTDNVGAFESNRDLSQRRAAAVVQELVSHYGVSSQRLFPFGVSYACPVAANETEEGRAKNRRVELVKM
jgi:outer membrane protein OmpA-like peptidoglycan-associated protein